MTIKTNPNREIVDSVRAALKENGGYCPCSLVKDEDHKCMCKDFIEQGLRPCHWELYVKVEV